MAVQALIQAAGSGTRLGRGPKAFVILDGKTLVEHAVELCQEVTDSVIVAVPAEDISKTQSLVGQDGVRIIECGSSRSETTRRLIAVATAPWLLLHDVVHPFASSSLVESLIDAANKHGAAAPGLPNTEYLYDQTGNLLHAPGEVLVGQKPVVISRDAVELAYQKTEAMTATREPSLIQLLELVGIRTKFVPGDPMNLKISESTDLKLAEAAMALK